MSDGAVAGDKFTIRPTVNGARDMAAGISDPAKIAAAMPIRTQASPRNLGTGEVSEATVNPQPFVATDPVHYVTDACLQQPVLISFNDPATSYNVSGLGTGDPIDIPYVPARIFPTTAGPCKSAANLRRVMCFAAGCQYQCNSR